MIIHSWAGLARVPTVGVLVLFVRASGKRPPAKLDAFDLVVAVALGSTLSFVLLEGSIALAQGVAAMATLIGLRFAVTFASVRSRRVEGVVKDEPTPLRDGRSLDAAMEARRVTRGEVLSALRPEGRADADGSLSVLDARPGRAAVPTLPTAS